MAEVEQNMGKKYGDPSDPLLFSVRSGAAVRCATFLFEEGERRGMIKGYVRGASVQWLRGLKV
jgi:hypothetical protein